MKCNEGLVLCVAVLSSLLLYGTQEAKAQGRYEEVVILAAMQWSLTLCLLSPFHYRSAIDSLVTALFFTGGINSKARLRQYSQYVEVDVKVDSD